MKRLVILGSTGSVGTQTLDIVRRFPERFRVLALGAGSNWRLLAEQAREFRPELVVIREERYYGELKEAVGKGVEVRAGKEALLRAASLEEADVVVSAIVGMAGLAPTFYALKSGKTVALANKEALVVGGPLILEVLKEGHAKIIPVDSEHSALFQVLKGHRRRDVARLILTASGGPFRTLSVSELKKVTPEMALKHPNWQMGAKITVDSATLMNKGLEVIEAHYLFSVPYERIEVVVHPQSIVHSLVEFKDGSVLAQLSLPDMRIPIAYALSYPERLDLGLKRLSLVEVGCLSFERPDPSRFPCLRLAEEAGRRGGFWPAVLNAANEEAVDAFLKRRIAFTQIPEVIERVLEELSPSGRPETLEDLFAVDELARKKAKEVIKGYGT